MNNKNIIEEGDILINPLICDLWIVIKEKNTGKLKVNLIHDEHEEYLDYVSGFELYAKKVHKTKLRRNL